MKTIGELDQNLRVETKLPNIPDVVFRDVCDEPFELYGLWKPEKGKPFCRMDPAVAEQVNPGVKALNFNTAGGRVRFCTDSAYVAISCTWPSLCQMPHMTLCGQSGFDLYEDREGVSDFINVYRPSIESRKGYESVLTFEERRLRYFTIHFPLYNPVDSLCIGLQKDALLGPGKKYRFEKPFLTYGSSITQGGCAGRPGLSYQAIISRWLSWDHLNLGFSGSACGEEPMREYLASLDPAVFVLDYDHNAPNPEHLRATHEPLFRRFREAHPDTPVLFVNRPHRPDAPGNAAPERRSIVAQTYDDARRAGDRNVWFIDGLSFFSGPFGECATVDNVHPNTYGFVRMAEGIGQVLAGLAR